MTLRKKRRKDYIKEVLGAEETVQLLSKVPVDFDVLRPGLLLPESLVERIINMSKEAKGYRFELLLFRDRVYSCTPYLTTTHEGGLLILTPSDAFHFERTALKKRLRGIGRNVTNVNTRIDGNALSLEEQQRLTTFKVTSAAVMFAMERALRGPAKIGFRRVIRDLGLVEPSPEIVKPFEIDEKDPADTRAY